MTMPGQLGDGRLGNCRTCSHPMRSSHARAEDHPGTVVHRRGDLCSACAHREDRALPGPSFHGGARNTFIEPDEIVVDLTLDGHRVPLNPAERELVVDRLATSRHPDGRPYTNAEIALMAGCSRRHVERIRARLRERIAS